MPMKKVDNLVYWERVGWKQGCSCLIHYAGKQTQGPAVLLPPQRTKRAPGTPVHALTKARVRLTDVGMTGLFLFCENYLKRHRSLNILGVPLSPSFRLAELRH